MGRADRGRDTRLPPVVVGGLAESKVRRVTAFIENNLHRELRLEELAAVTHMSRYHFARLFKRATGVSPHRFVVRRRIDAATALLTESTSAISSAHHGHDAERVSSAQSRRRAASRDAARRRRGRRREDSHPPKVDCSRRGRPGHEGCHRCPESSIYKA